MYTREAHFSYTPYSGYGNNLRPIIRRFALPPDAIATPQANGSYLMVVHDIPGIVDEPLMPPYMPIQSRVTFYYQESDAPPAAGPSDKFWNHYGEKWGGDMEKFIDKKKALDADLAKIVTPGDSPEVKLGKIYARVQTIRNLSYEDYKSAKEYKDENLKPNLNVEDVLNHNYGYGRQINDLFIGLARAAGFDATAVFIAPRNIEMFIPSGNDESELSDDVVWVYAGSKDHYLNPAARYFPFGILPWYETSTSGIKVDKHGATIVDTPDPVASDAALVRNAELEIQPSGEITGTIRVDYAGQRGALIRGDERKDDDSGRKKFFEAEIKSWLPAGADFTVSKILN
jgi:hypothetical protein